MMQLSQCCVLSFICLLLVTSCKSFSESAKFELNNGYYKAREEGGADRRVYVYTTEDTLVAFPIVRQNNIAVLDTSGRSALLFPRSIQGAARNSQTFHKYSFDLDVLAIPFKYRFETAGEPRRLNTQFNGAVYAGFRTDRYKVDYEPTPLGIANRSIVHYGYSIGLFSGIGVEPINPWVTKDRYPGEYDGIVWLNGVAAIVGVNNFTFGLGVGVDHLLDRNREIWIYQGKPWLGLTLGLNLN